MATFALVGAGLGLTSVSEAAQTRPLTVARCQCGGESPLLATSARHGSIIAWREGDKGDRLIARRIHRDGTLGRKRKLARWTDPITKDAWIAVGRSGAGVAVWEDNGGGISARRLTRRGKLGRIHRVARDSGTFNDSFDVDVGVDAAGNAAIVWARYLDSLGRDSPSPPTTVRARRLTAKGELGPRIDLRLAVALNHTPRVAVAASGRATVVWSFCCSGEAIGALAAATIGSDGAVGTARGIPGWWVGAPEMAVDSRGNVTLVGNADYQVVTALRIRAGGALGPMQVLGSGRFEEGRPRVAVDRAGNASVTWNHSGTLQLRRIGADGTLGPVTNLSAPATGTTRFGEPDVAVDPAGNATVAWNRSTSPVEDPWSFAIQARGVALDAKLGAIRTLSNSSAWLWGPTVVADARGVVTAAWSEIRQRGQRGDDTIKLARLVRRRGK